MLKYLQDVIPWSSHNNIAVQYGVQQGYVKITEFSDGEFCPSFEETVRGNRVFLIQSTNPPADNLMELLLLCDAANEHLPSILQL